MLCTVALSSVSPNDSRSDEQPEVTFVMMLEMLALVQADWEQAPVSQVLRGWMMEVELPPATTLMRLLALMHSPSELVATLCGDC